MKARKGSGRGGLTIDIEDDEYLSKGNLAEASGRGVIEVDLNSLRVMVQASLKQNLYENAIFFANKLVTLSGMSNQEDVFLLAQAYYLGKQYRRAVHVLDRYGLLLAHSRDFIEEENSQLSIAAMPSSTKSIRLHSTRSIQSVHRPVEAVEENNENLEYVFLAAMCLIESGEDEEAQSLVETVLGDATIEQLQARTEKVKELMTEKYNSPNREASRSFSEQLQLTAGLISPVASLCLLRGRVYEKLDNRPRAVRWFKSALFCDIRCYEAFAALIDNQLKPAEEGKLLDDLRSKGAFANPENKWLEVVYASKLAKHDFSKPASKRFEKLKLVVPKNSIQSGTSLDKDLDCIATKAECMYQQHDPQGAYQLTQWIRKRDPYQLKCVTVHLAALVELKKKSELFYFAHSLVDAYPTRAVAWFAVGCYYYSISKFDVSRRYFHKATTMDPSLAPAWLGFGHSFASQDESDQAMAAYRTASRLFIGCHLPVLCTAIEYLRTNNISLAEQFCRQAKQMCPTDPLVLNELGVVHYKQKRYQQAAECFHEALRLCQKQPERLRAPWEPVMFNLGHTYRKLGKYSEAIYQYQLALSYSPREASTYAALGLTFHLQGKLEEAINHYHNALGLKPEDTFSGEMINKALAESYQSTGPEDVQPQDIKASKPVRVTTPKFTVHIPDGAQDDYPMHL